MLLPFVSSPNIRLFMAFESGKIVVILPDVNYADA
jgi:hypothetical protein